MADAIVKVVNNRPVVKVAGSELLTPMVAAAQAARDAVRPLFGEGPPDAAAVSRAASTGMSATPTLRWNGSRRRRDGKVRRRSRAILAAPRI